MLRFFRALDGTQDRLFRRACARNSISDREDPANGSLIGRDTGCEVDARENHGRVLVKESTHFQVLLLALAVCCNCIIKELQRLGLCVWRQVQSLTVAADVLARPDPLFVRALHAHLRASLPVFHPRPGLSDDLILSALSVNCYSASIESQSLGHANMA